MATVADASKNLIKLDNGKTVTASTGGWYDGSQYWNGTLSAKGVINSQSNQQGAGQAVSNEILKSTSVAAGKAPDANYNYIYGGSSSGNSGVPATPEKLGTYLDNFQTQQYQSLTVPDFKIPTAMELKAELAPTKAAPEPLNRVQLLEQQKASMGVTDLETELNTLKTEENTIKADLRATTSAEEGKSVALNVMAGRMTEEQRVAQTKLDYLNVRKATVVDELTTKYNAINTYIQYAGLDYQDAVKAYESEFDKNVQIQNLLSGFRKEAWSYATDSIKLQETMKQNNIDNARANLTTITNAITGGNMSYSNLSSEEKLNIQKLEIQSGLPVGTVAALKSNAKTAKDNVIATYNDGGQVTVVMKDANGKPYTEVIGTKKETSSLTPTQINEAKQKVMQLEGYTNADLEKVATDLNFYNWVMAQ